MWTPDADRARTDDPLAAAVVAVPTVGQRTVGQRAGPRVARSAVPSEARTRVRMKRDDRSSADIRERRAVIERDNHARVIGG